MNGVRSHCQFGVRLLLLVIVGVLTFFQLGSAHAFTTTTPDGELRKYNLKNDEASLLVYLQSGIPDVPLLDSDRRWGLYRTVVAKLGEVSGEDSVLPLIGIIEMAPAGRVQQDLILDAGKGDTWDRWDSSCAKSLADLRGDAAMSLARIGDSRALPVLQAYLERLTKVIEANFACERPDSGILWSYGAVCKAITVLGAKEGIDAMMESLDGLAKANPDMVVYNLRICTRQTFGPEYSQPRHLWPGIVGEWRTWWSENREEFLIDRDEILRLTKPNIPQPEANSLREHVVAAQTRSFDYAGTGYGKRSAEWLETACVGYREELAAIVEDRDEDAQVRREAMEWFAASCASAGGALAEESLLDLLKRYAIGEDMYSEDGPDRMLLQNQALKLIGEYYPDALDEVAKRCAVSQYDTSSNAVHMLMASVRNHEFVADNVAVMHRAARSQALQALLNHPEPVGRTAFIAALSSADLFEAMFGARGVEKFGLEGELSEESKLSLAKWRTVPMFRLRTLELISGGRDKIDSAAVLEILAGLPGSDVESAGVYRRACFMLPPEERGVALEGLVGCVAAYKQARGL